MIALAPILALDNIEAIDNRVALVPKGASQNVLQGCGRWPVGERGCKAISPWYRWRGAREFSRRQALKAAQAVDGARRLHPLVAPPLQCYAIPALPATHPPAVGPSPRFPSVSKTDTMSAQRPASARTAGERRGRNTPELEAAINEIHNNPCP